MVEVVNRSYKLVIFTNQLMPFSRLMNRVPTQPDVRRMLKSIKQFTLHTLKSTGVFKLCLESPLRQQRLLILAYHGISMEDEHECDPDLFMSPDYFRTRMELLSRYKCNVLPLEDAIDSLIDGTLPENSVALTFDDGCHNFYSRAYPILREFGYPATLYLSTFYVFFNRPVFDPACQYILWKSREKTLDLSRLTGARTDFDLSDPYMRRSAFQLLRSHSARTGLGATEKDELLAKISESLGFDYQALAESRIMNYLNPEEIKFLASEGIDFQLHTHNHRIAYERDRFTKEITDNIEHIQRLTETELAHFCYPGGRYDRKFLPWLSDMNITSATTCDPGLATRKTNRWMLPRLVDVSALSAIEFEGWLTGVSNFIPRKRMTYNPGHS